MKRIGLYTGNEYGNEISSKDIKECCINVSDDGADDLSLKRARGRCYLCQGDKNCLKGLNV